MGMPITIIRTIFQIEKRTTSWYRLTGLGGIRSIWPLRPSQSNLSLWQKELFTNRIFAGGFACGAFPIDRENPGAEAIKYPVNMLKKSNRSLIMFPSGSRHSQDVKGGVAIIAKMAKVRIMPVTYTGQRDLKGLATGERIDMNFGHPIDISDIKR